MDVYCPRKVDPTGSMKLILFGLPAAVAARPASCSPCLVFRALEYLTDARASLSFYAALAGSPAPNIGGTFARSGTLFLFFPDPLAWGRNQGGIHHNLAAQIDRIFCGLRGVCVDHLRDLASSFAVPSRNESSYAFQPLS